MNYIILTNKKNINTHSVYIYEVNKLPKLKYNNNNKLFTITNKDLSIFYFTLFIVVIISSRLPLICIASTHFKISFLSFLLPTQ